MLQPSEVGVAFRRRAVCPTWVIGQGFAPPIADVEWRVCHDEIHLFVDVLRLGEAVGVVFAEVVINAADGHVHGGKFPCGGVEFLPVDGNDVDVALMGGDKSFGLYEKAAAAHGRVIYAARVWLEHFDNQGNYGFGREILAAAFAFGLGKATEEVFVNVAENVFCAQMHGLAVVSRTGKVGIGKEDNQPAQSVFVYRIAADALEDTFEFFVVFFNGIEGIINQFCHARKFPTPR